MRQDERPTARASGRHVILEGLKRRCRVLLVRRRIEARHPSRSGEEHDRGGGRDNASCDRRIREALRTVISQPHRTEAEIKGLRVAQPPSSCVAFLVAVVQVFGAPPSFVAELKEELKRTQASAANATDESCGPAVQAFMRPTPTIRGLSVCRKMKSLSSSGPDTNLLILSAVKSPSLLKLEASHARREQRQASPDR